MLDFLKSRLFLPVAAAFSIFLNLGWVVSFGLSGLLGPGIAIFALALAARNYALLQDVAGRGDDTAALFDEIDSHQETIEAQAAQLAELREMMNELALVVEENSGQGTTAPASPVVPSPEAAGLAQEALEEMAASIEELHQQVEALAAKLTAPPAAAEPPSLSDSLAVAKRLAAIESDTAARFAELDQQLAEISAVVSNHADVLQSLSQNTSVDSTQFNALAAQVNAVQQTAAGLRAQWVADVNATVQERLTTVTQQLGAIDQRLAQAEAQAKQAVQAAAKAAEEATQASTLLARTHTQATAQMVQQPTTPAAPMAPVAASNPVAPAASNTVTAPTARPMAGPQPNLVRPVVPPVSHAAQTAQVATTSTPAVARPAASPVVEEEPKPRPYELMLQPIFRLPERDPVWFEGYTRLRGADGRVVESASHVELARAEGWLTEVDRALFTRCVGVAQELRTAGRVVGVVCNLSVQTMRDYGNREAFIAVMQSDAHLSGSVIFEFSQAELADADAVTLTALRELSTAGIRFSLDNITDWSLDLAAMAQLGFRFVKLPATEFLARVARAGGRADRLTQAFEKLGLTYVVEKIETEAELAQVLAAGAPFGQGLALAPPNLIRQDS